MAARKGRKAASRREFLKQSLGAAAGAVLGPAAIGWAAGRGAWAGEAAAGVNLLKNGDFAAEDGGRPAEWAVEDRGQKVTLDKQEKPAGVGQSLRVDVVKDAGEGYGEIAQKIAIKPGTLYRLEGDLRMTQARQGLYQVKLFKGRGEISRLGTDDVAAGQWQTVTKEFPTGAADSVQVLCRWRQNRLSVGQTAWFARVKLTEVGPAPAEVQKPVPAVAEPRAEAVPTFECIGLTWSHPQGSATVAAQVTYRAAGEAEWRPAQDLWFDGRALGGRPPEYRGSIVGLKAGTKYDVRLALAGTPVIHLLQVTTWSEAFPIAKTVELPATSAAMLEINNVHGSPDGYILYTGPGGGPATIDVAGQARCNIRVIRSSYLIFRGLTLTGAQQHAIMLGKDDDDIVHDFVIENCDISGWGSNDASGFGVDHHSGVYSESKSLERVVIQRNRIHDPRSNANSWLQNRKGGTTQDHPLGPQAISLMAGKGRYVVRYNEMAGNPTHHFNDSMGADANFTFGGFPNRDSDVYGNFVAYCWDDGLEIEGANMNVRVWGNYITETYHPIANAAVSLGPLYIFRNVAYIGRAGPKDTYGQSWMKSGGSRTRHGYFGDGRCYVLNNTILILPGSEPQVRGGIGAGDRTLKNYVTRNNILQVPAPTGSRSGRLGTLAASISDPQESDTNSFDYDLYNGKIGAVAGSESHGIKGVPTYADGVGFDPKTMTGRFALAPGSPGHDAGAVVPNFTDGHTGAAPDVGAHESGTPPMQFGVRAYLPAGAVK